jgi:putative flippase GtrA
MERLRQQLRTHKQLRYVVSGLASEAIEYLAFALLLFTTHLLIFSNSIGFLLGIASGFVLHKLWSFAGEQQFKTHQQVVGYGMLAAVNFFAANLLVGWLVYGLDIAPLLAKLISMAVIAAWSFVLFNRVIFKQRS